jgi:hypothetical protein
VLDRRAQDVGISGALQPLGEVRRIRRGGVKLLWFP